MPRLLVHVEGRTEERFVNELLSGELIPFGFESVRARIIGRSHNRNRRGGIRPWGPVKGDILRHLDGDSGAVATMLVDYYALPRDWPGRRTAEEKHGASGKAEHIEALLLEDLVQTTGNRFDARRFVPFIVMHEFEGLLFSNPEAFARSISRPDLTANFAAIRGEFESPEEINDSEHHAPSKRIRDVFPAYEKPRSGTLAAYEIGIETIRSQCPHFQDWLHKLERLPQDLAYLG